MTRRRQPQVTERDFRRFKETMLQAKASERTRQPHGDAAPVIYHDALLRTLVVVEHGGQLWLCPRRPGGWSSRQRLQMTDAARSERLGPARDISAGWLGVITGNGCEDSTETSAAGQT